MKCAPETGPKIRIIANSPAAVAAAFSSSCSPVSSRELLRGDAGADDQRGEQRAAEELGQKPSWQAARRGTYSIDNRHFNRYPVDRWPIDLELAPKTKRPAGEPCCEPVVYPDVEREQAIRMAEVAKALGDPIRLQLVDVLRKHAGKVCVCELVPLFDISQPTLSHHLKKLREAGIVDSERRGLWAYYYVLPDALQELTAWLS